MLRKISLVVFFAIFFMGTGLWAHEEDVNGRIDIQLLSSNHFEVGKTTFYFQLHDKIEKKEITDKSLNVVHEKLLHLFIFDKGLGEFQHLHPEYKENKWVTEASFSKSGDYLIWTQGQLSDDLLDFVSNYSITVSGGSEANIVPPVLKDIREGEDGLSIVKMTNLRFVKNMVAQPNINFFRKDGTSPSLENYLGAKAHVVVTPVDADSLIHTHPMDHDVPNQLMLHMTFPEAGFFRLWIQFIDGGQLRVVPLSVQVFEK